MKPSLCIVSMVLACVPPFSARAQTSDEVSTLAKASLVYARCLRSVEVSFAVFNRADGQHLADGELGMEADKVFFDYLQKDPAGKVTWSERYTWNGLQACDLFHTDGNKMAVGKERFACSTLEDRNPVVDPFAFLLGERDTGPGADLTLAELADPAAWDRWAASARVQGHEKLATGECVVVECPGRTKALQHPQADPYTLRVWFAADHRGFPVRWQQISAGKMTAQFDAVTLDYLDAAKSLPFVRECHFYRVYPNGVVADDVRVSVTRAKNDAAFPGDAFTIDPDLANTLWDSTAKTWLKKLHVKPDPMHGLDLRPKFPPGVPR